MNIGVTYEVEPARNDRKRSLPAVRDPGHIQPERQPRRRIGGRGFRDVAHRVGAGAVENRRRDGRGMEDMISLAEQARGAQRQVVGVGAG